MSERAPADRGRQRDILGYLFAYPGKHVTITELEKHFKGKYNRNQIMGTMAHVCNVNIQKRYNLPIERITTGVWRVVERQDGEPELKVEEPVHRKENVMYVEILKERAEHLIVEDVDDGKIYKMILVG